LKKLLLLLILAFPMTYLSNRPSFALDGQSQYKLVYPPDQEVATQVEGLSEDELRAQAQLDRYYTHRYLHEHFNGTVLIAHEGRTIYRRSFGYADIPHRRVLNDNTAFELASVSKTFTATAILRLVAQHQVRLDDSLSCYFPAFPYHNITIRMLLSHRTGLPDYVYLDDRYIRDRKHYMSNIDVVNLFSTRRVPLEFAPNTKFDYSNTNYALLAAVLEQVTGISYRNYMLDSVFTPLGMTHTYVYNPKTNHPVTIAQTHDDMGRPMADVCFDGVVGDKGIFSTADDMLKWDNALKMGKVASCDMMDEAYKPRSFESKSFVNCYQRNYGYGWRMARQADGNSIIFHNGWWHGNNNVFARNLRDNTTIIVLGNRFNNGNYYTEPIWNILKSLQSSHTDMSRTAAVPYSPKGQTMMP
jgi:CubicO group peptidase (beta-lactamase class C family)